MGTTAKKKKMNIAIFFNTTTKKLKNEIKRSFPEVFSEGLNSCIKTKVKDNVTKRSIPFAALEQIIKELDRLEKIRCDLRISLF